MAKSKKARVLSRQANRGIPHAMYQLGLCYFEGRGVSEDTQRGAELIRQAALEGYDLAKEWMEDYLFDDDAQTQGNS